MPNAGAWTWTAFHGSDPPKPRKIAPGGWPLPLPSGESIRIQDLSEDEACIRELEWAQREGLVGFAGRSLVFRGEVLGVLAVFRRTAPNEVCWEWLRTLADHTAAAIANARANEQIGSLRREPELERDYLREELSESTAFGDILGHSASVTASKTAWEGA
jgi:GAF domain-containing protein